MSVVKRRRKKRSGSQYGELYQIVQSDTVLFEQTYPSDGAALSRAQNLLSTLGLGKVQEEITYTVRLKPVLGPPDDLYRVTLTAEGVVETHRVK